ncbi:MAG: hypothetical protein AAB778_00145 [Patescibacteria group bacterium]
MVREIDVVDDGMLHSAMILPTEKTLVIEHDPFKRIERNNNGVIFGYYIAIENGEIVGEDGMKFRQKLESLLKNPFTKIQIV